MRRIADEIGYVPNRAGVRLRTGRTNVIALVLGADTEVLNMTPRLIASVAGALAGSRFHLIVVPELPGQNPMEPVRHIVETRAADAIILNRIAPEDPRVAYLLEHKVPFATHGRSVWSDRHPYFDFDNRAFGRQAVSDIAARGRTSCLLIAPPQDQSYGRDVVEGAREVAAEAGISLQVLDLTSDDPCADIAEAIQAHLELHPGIDAVIAASPHAAMAAVRALEDGGAELGTDFDVFAKETFPVLDLFREGILSMPEDVDAAGRFLARAAVSAIEHPDGPYLQRLDGPDRC